MIQNSLCIFLKLAFTEIIFVKKIINKSKIIINFSLESVYLKYILSQIKKIIKNE